MKEVVLRIAPSPSKATGTDKSGLHVGNVRTALFNWLYSKRHNGSFILRIENTDQERCSATGAEDILAELLWLGLVPNRGYGAEDKPAVYYTQMERLPIYKEYVDRLLDMGAAYKCYCTSENLDQARTEALAKNPKAPFKYSGVCRNADQSQDKDYVIRFKAPTEGAIEFDDLVFGKKSFTNKENYDFVIARSNGVPLFHMANAIDDFFIDNVSHVVRGRDHLSGVMQQLLIGNALGLKEPPVYAHLSMILGSPDENGKAAKLSKRDGSVSVREFRNAGYAPKAILNYLARLGWSYKDQEIFSLEELIEKFDLNAINKADGKFDYKKFATVNAAHLKSEALLPDQEYAMHLKPFLNEKGFSLTEEEIIPFVKVIRSRAKTFVEAALLIEPMLKVNVTLPQELCNKVFTPTNRKLLLAMLDLFKNLDFWGEHQISESMTSLFETGFSTLKDAGPPLRVALLGQTQSPELALVLAAMGRERVVRRLQEALEMPVSEANCHIDPPTRTC